MRTRTGQGSLPLVSVIITTYNRLRLVPLAIESVLAQTYPAIEIIVVDDGSTDDTPGALARYAGRVTYIRQANQGLAAARNTGIRAAHGDYVNVLDDDDFFLPHKISRQIELFASRPELGLVHCGYYNTDAAGRSLDQVTHFPEGDPLQELVRDCFLLAHTPLIRRRCLDEVGLFDEQLPWPGRYCEDWDLWLRLARTARGFAYVPEALCAYRIHGASQVDNIAKLEAGSIGVLHRVFSWPDLPGEARLLQDEAYGLNHFSLACRYYAGSLWDDGRRQLALAAIRYPRFLQDGEFLIQRLCGQALSARVIDPLGFLAGILDHLPAGAEGLSRHRAEAESRVRIRLALRSAAAGSAEEAQGHLQQALALQPRLLGEPRALAAMFCEAALSLPVEAPERYLAMALEGLQGETRLRACVMGNLHVIRAFEAYAVGHRHAVVGQALRALRHDPSWIGNRGVASILLRSLLGSLTESRGIRK